MNVSPQYSSANLNLVDGSTTTIGDAGNQAITFSGFNSPTLEGSPILINTGSGRGTMTINSLTIGPLKEDINKIIASDLNLLAGVSYSLIVRIVPNDKYETHNGINVVTINGKSWMLHNLGATGPDNNPLTASSHGNYYQFGRKAVVMAHNESSVNNNWRGTFNEITKFSWNKGNENTPVKNTNNDPCPTGFRVPTKTEFEHLFAATVRTNTGSNKFAYTSMDFN